ANHHAGLCRLRSRSRRSERTHKRRETSARQSRPYAVRTLQAGWLASAFAPERYFYVSCRSSWSPLVALMLLSFHRLNQRASVSSESGTAWQVRHWSVAASPPPSCATLPSTMRMAQLSHWPTRQPLGRDRPAAWAASRRVPSSGDQTKLWSLPAMWTVCGSSVRGTIGG